MFNGKKISKEKISLSESKKILGALGNALSDAEIISVRDFLYRLAEIDIAVFNHLQEKERNEEILKEKAKAEKDKKSSAKDSDEDYKSAA